MLTRLQAAIKEQGTFAQRKQARIDAGAQGFTFEVEARFPFNGEVVGSSFKSRNAARDFAFASRSIFVGDTGAQRALEDRHPREHVNFINFYVVRVSAECGDRRTVAAY